MDTEENSFPSRRVWEAHLEIMQRNDKGFLVWSSNPPPAQPGQPSPPPLLVVLSSNPYPTTLSQSSFAYISIADTSQDCHKSLARFIGKFSLQIIGNKS